MVRCAFIVLVCAMSVSLTASTLVYENAGGERHLTLRRDGEQLVIVDERSRAIVASAPAATTERVVIQGAAGDRNDRLAIDFSQPIVLRDGIDYDGGANGWDVLELTGGSAQRQQVTQINPHDGDIDIDGLVIRYRNLEPITDTVTATNFTINGTTGADTVTISDGPGGTATISSATFESVTFANKTNVVFDGRGGGDKFTFSNPNPATGMTSFVVTNVNVVVQTQRIRYSSLGVNATGVVNLGSPQANYGNDVDRIEITTQGNVLFQDVDDVIVGDVTSALQGVRAGESHHALIVANGSITLSDSDGAEVIRAGGVTLQAGVDITCTVDRHAIIAPNYSVTLSAGRDILLGTAAFGFANDVRAGGYAMLEAGRSITIAGRTTVEGTQADLGIVAPPVLPALYLIAKEIVQRDEAMFLASGKDAEAAVEATSVSFLGDVIGLHVPTGYAFIATDDLVISPASGIAAPLDTVQISSPGVSLGTAGDVTGPPMELSDEELGRVTAPQVLIFSRGQKPIEITAPVSFRTGTTLSLYLSTILTASGSGRISAPHLRIAGANGFAPQHWTIARESIQMNDGAAVPYHGVSYLTIYASGVLFPDGSGDIVTVAPSDTTAIKIYGQFPLAGEKPGDTLRFDLDGVVHPVLTAEEKNIGYVGTLTSNNRQPVEFESFEAFENAPVDLRITNTDGVAIVRPGEQVTYTITVTNATGIPVERATVDAALPTQLEDVRWTCTRSEGSDCALTGRDSLHDVITVAAGGWVTYSVTGKTSAAQTGVMISTATVTAPDGYVESSTSDNSATDRTVVEPEASRRSRAMRRR